MKKKHFIRALTIPLTISFLLGGTCFAEEKRVTEATVEQCFQDLNQNMQTAGDELMDLLSTDNSDIVDQTVAATVSWDETAAPLVRPDIKTLLGNLYEPVEGEDLTVDKYGNLDAAIIRKSGNMYSQPLACWGGDASELYNTVNMILPMDRRQIGNGGEFLNRSVAYGPIEFIKQQYANNPGVAFLWNLSMTAATPENNANFLRFLTDAKDASTWGAVRVSSGIEEPCKVFGIELGAKAYASGQSVQDYIASFKAHAEALRSVIPSVKCIPGLNPNGTSEAKAWNQAVISALGAEYPYLGVSLFYTEDNAKTQKQISDILDICTATLGENHGAQLVISQHGRAGSGNAFSRLSLGAALEAGQFLNQIAQNPHIAAACYNGGLTNTKSSVKERWSVFGRFADGTYAFSGINELLRIYTNNIGDRVLASTVTGDSPLADAASSDCKLTVLATPKESSKMTVFLCNKDPYTAFDLTFATKNHYSLRREIIYSAPNIASFALSESEEGKVYRVADNYVGGTLGTYHLPPKSLVCLVMDSREAITDSKEAKGSDGEVIYTGENHFADIEGNWAYNEINLLAEKEVVNGMGDGSFQPQDSVTYAEFVSMLTKAFGIPASTSGTQIFNNVPPDSWYFGVINAMAEHGYIRRTTPIDPERQVTLREAAFMIYQMAGNPPAGSTYMTDNFFSKNPDLTSYEKSAFTYEIKNGIMTKLFEGTTPAADKGLNRSEAAYCIYHAMQVVGKK